MKNMAVRKEDFDSDKLAGTFISDNRLFVSLLSVRNLILSKPN